MNLPSVITDNVAELLFKIIEFTRTRQKILTKNINNISEPQFLPKDLAVDEFSGSLHNAINEHITNRRLILRDTANIKFGIEGRFEAIPVIDRFAKELLEQNRNGYIELQIDKLLENSLNQRVAAELLRQKQSMTSNFD